MAYRKTKYNSDYLQGAKAHIKTSDSRRTLVAKTKKRYCAT